MESPLWNWVSFIRSDVRWGAMCVVLTKHHLLVLTWVAHLRGYVCTPVYIYTFILYWSCLTIWNVLTIIWTPDEGDRCVVRVDHTSSWAQPSGPEDSCPSLWCDLWTSWTLEDQRPVSTHSSQTANVWQDIDSVMEFGEILFRHSRVCRLQSMGHSTVYLSCT